MKLLIPLLIFLAGCVTTPEPVEVAEVCPTQMYEDWYLETLLSNPDMDLNQQLFDGEAEANMVAHYNASPPQSSATVDDLDFRIVFKRGDPRVVLVISANECIVNIQAMDIRAVMALTMTLPKPGLGI